MFSQSKIKVFKNQQTVHIDGGSSRFSDFHHITCILVTEILSFEAWYSKVKMKYESFVWEDRLSPPVFKSESMIVMMPVTPHHVLTPNVKIAVQKSYSTKIQRSGRTFRGAVCKTMSSAITMCHIFPFLR